MNQLRSQSFPLQNKNAVPTAPLHPCPAKGCGVLVSKGRCAKHGGPHKWDAPRANPVVRKRGHWLMDARRRLFERQPLCEPCQQAGRLTVATIRDHKIPLAEGGTEDESNEQAICEPCHRAKSQQEAMRGRTR